MEMSKAAKLLGDSPAFKTWATEFKKVLSGMLTRKKWSSEEIAAELDLIQKNIGIIDVLLKTRYQDRESLYLKMSRQGAKKVLSPAVVKSTAAIVVAAVDQSLDNMGKQ